MYYGRYTNCKCTVLELTGTKENLRYSIIGLQLTSQQSCNNSLRKKFYCFDPKHGCLAMWLQTKNTQPCHVGGARRNGSFRKLIPPTNFIYQVQCNLKFQQKPCHIQITSWPVSANISRTKLLASQSVTQSVSLSVISQ